MPSNNSINQYKFSFVSALYISVLCGFLMNIGRLLKINNLEEFFKIIISYESLLVVIIVFSISFFVIQIRFKHMFFEKVRKIYKDLEYKTDSVISTSSLDSDMSSLIEDMGEFVKLKRGEVELLKREGEYRKEFIGNVAHELKTPLFSIQGYVSNLLDGALNDKVLLEKYLKRADKSVERLAFIVQDLDLISQIESSTIKLNIESFSIVKLVMEIIEELEINATKKKIKLVFDKDYIDDIIVDADRNRIHQVLSNLILNSINYGRQKGTTEISFDTQNKKVFVRVNDNGEGISDENMPRLFERFFRVDVSRSRSHGGSGLGLAIVKHIVDAHKENIYVQSTLGIGSEFSFSLKKSIIPSK